MSKPTLRCRFCNEPIQFTFADLGVQPVCESYLEPDQLNRMEPFYPLHVFFCSNCLLVQLEESITPQEIFNNYSYFSSHSKGWLKHSEDYAKMITKRLNLGESSDVVEIGSNDGYLLQYFVQKNIRVLGIEPAANVAEESVKKGIPTMVKFFGSEISSELARQHGSADLLIVNNVLAQVPDLNGFVDGLRTMLKPSGIMTIEFHHIMNLIDKVQFDTVSHERFSHFSLNVLEKILAKHCLTIFDAEEIPTHGGSLRIYVCHAGDNSRVATPQVDEIRAKEKTDGLTGPEKYLSFAERVKATKRNILSKLIDIKQKKKSIVGYGAHAEAHTLLNYCGIRSDFIDYLVDRNPFKQGKFLAGTRIPIFHPDKIKETKPDYVLVLPWAIKTEIMSQMSYVGEWGAKFIVPIPKLQVFNSQGLEIVCNEEESR